MNRSGYASPTRVGVIARNIPVSSTVTSNRNRLTSVSTRQASGLDSVAVCVLSSVLMRFASAANSLRIRGLCPVFLPSYEPARVSIQAAVRKLRHSCAHRLRRGERGGGRGGGAAHRRREVGRQGAGARGRPR